MCQLYKNKTKHYQDSKVPDFQTLLVHQHPFLNTDKAFLEIVTNLEHKYTEYRENLTINKSIL